jgi:putative nucleotidyltransferase with HDIG domain
LIPRWTDGVVATVAGAGSPPRIKGSARLPIPSHMRAARLAPVSAVLLAIAATAAAVASSGADDWRQPGVLALLLVFAVAADRFEIQTRSGSYISGSMPTFVLAAALYGPAPAAAVGAVTAIVQRRKAWQLVAGDAAIFTAFPLVTGLAADGAARWAGDAGELWFAVTVAALFMLAWTVNVALVAAYMRMLKGRRLGLELAATWRPLLSSQLAHALGTALLAYLFLQVGAAAIVFAGVLIVTYSRLQHDLLEAERVRDQAEERSEQLAAANERLRRSHFGAMRSLVRSIHLHDHMTARHSAAVARYARAIARAAGRPKAEQDLVHTAGLLHDVGKHILTDAILKGDTKLDQEQWELVKRHPEEGARIVRLLEGHDEIAAIIHAHHERIDGRGYPRGLAGEEIPLLARMISVADTYDVMTARDSYRDPVSSAEAVAELRRVAGAQLDAQLVELFVEHVVGEQAAAFGHSDDADFEEELALDGRMADDKASSRAEAPLDAGTRSDGDHAGPLELVSA